MKKYIHYLIAMVFLCVAPYVGHAQTVNQTATHAWHNTKSFVHRNYTSTRDLAKKDWSATKRFTNRNYTSAKDQTNRTLYGNRNNNTAVTTTTTMPVTHRSNIYRTTARRSNLRTAKIRTRSTLPPTNVMHRTNLHRVRHRVTTTTQTSQYHESYGQRSR
jgi:hypothetical protein